MANAVTLPKLAVEIHPLGDQVAVVPLEAEQMTASGIVIPDTATEKKSQEGIVIALGDGKMKKDGINPRDHMKIGDKVLFGKYAGEDLTVKDKNGKNVDIKILDAESVRAILK